MNILASILQSLRDAALYNRHELAAPRVILWPDEEELWAQCIDALREHYPSLWTLGEYAPDKAVGPAAWLRYQLDTQSSDDIPMLYLPGVSRAAFRNADQCPGQAKHLFALQYQGQFWTQRNGKDWTPFAYLSSQDVGLGLDVAANQDTRKAIQESLPVLLDVEDEALRGRKLEASDFRAIVTRDPAQTLLRWMGDPNNVRQELQKSGAAWDSFCAICRDNYHFDPEKDGAITAAEQLSAGKGEWVQVWNRYKEAPRYYPGVKEVLTQVPSPPRRMFEPATEYLPRTNQDMEEQLERELLGLAAMEPKQAIETIRTLADDHAYRARWVWAELGCAPLAQAIIFLRDLAEATQTSGTPATWEALAAFYAKTGADLRG